MTRMLVFVTMISCCAFTYAGDPNTTRLLDFGGIRGSGGSPSPDELAPVVNTLDKLPFQAHIYNITNNGGAFANLSMNGVKRFSLDELKPDIELMKKLTAISKKEAFVRIYTSADLVCDWFDDTAWNNIIANMKLASYAAKQVNAEGFMLDNEQYNRTPFGYIAQSGRFEHSFAEYQAKARQRGKAYSSALCSEVPDAKLIMLFCNSMLAKSNVQPKDVEQNLWGLLPSFMDGMIDGLSSDAQLFDGHEDYSLRTYNDFQNVRKLVKEQAPRYSSDPQRYSKVVKFACPVWLREIYSEYKLDVKDYNNNFYNPEEVKHAIHYAMLVSDGYVWLYTFPWSELPKEYIDAVADAKKPQSLDYVPRVKSIPDYIISTKGRPDCTDEATFSAYWKKYDELFDFPKLWKFKMDANDIGMKEQWFKDGIAGDWKDFYIGDWWDPQLKENYKGLGWYKTEFDGLESWKNKKLMLVFGAIDEEAWIWLNGKLVAERANNIEAWNNPIEIDISKDLKIAQKNSLVVRVRNNAGVGGIFKSVKIFTDKSK